MCNRDSRVRLAQQRWREPGCEGGLHFSGVCNVFCIYSTAPIEREKADWFAFVFPNVVVVGRSVPLAFPGRRPLSAAHHPSPLRLRAQCEVSTPPGLVRPAHMADGRHHACNCRSRCQALGG